MPSPVPPEAAAREALAAWNMMGGYRMEALPVVCDLLQPEDVERLVALLGAIDAHQRAQREVR